MRTFLILMLVSLNGLSALASNNNNTFYRWNLQQEIGTNFMLTKWKIGSLSDYLISNNEPNPYWKMLDVTYNFSPKFSLRLSFQINLAGDPQRGSKFDQAVQTEKATDFFIRNISTDINRKSPFFVLNTERFQLGFLYHHTIGNFTISPGLSIGQTAFYSEMATVYLKEKGTNYTFETNYTAGTRFQNYVTFSPSVMISCLVTNRTAAYFQTSYYINNYDFSYEEITTNIFEQTNTTVLSNYKGVMHSLGLGIGLRLNLRKLN